MVSKAQAVAAIAVVCVVLALFLSRAVSHRTLAVPAPPAGAQARNGDGLSLKPGQRHSRANPGSHLPSEAYGGADSQTAGQERTQFPVGGSLEERGQASVTGLDSAEIQPLLRFLEDAVDTPLAAGGTAAPPSGWKLPKRTAVMNTLATLSMYRSLENEDAANSAHTRCVQRRSALLPEDRLPPTIEPQLHSASLLKFLKQTPSHHNRLAAKLFSKQLAAGRGPTAKSSSNDTLPWKPIILLPFTPVYFVGREAKHGDKSTPPWLGGFPAPAVCVFRSAFTDKGGKVCSQDACLAPRSCDPTRTSAVEATGPAVDELLVLSQPRGSSYYHFSQERLPRVVLALDILRARPAMKVHVAAEFGFIRNMLAMVGIEESRFVTGPVRARAIVYPEPSSCGNPHLHVLLAWQRLLNEVVGLAWMPKHQPGRGGAAGASKAQRRLVIVIKRPRGHSRSFANHDEVLSALGSALRDVEDPETALPFEVRQFDIAEYRGDNPQRDSLADFSNAAAVVAPHGAGLANIIACAPGTVVVEVLRPAKSINTCFFALSLKLGLQYHAYGPKKSIRKKGWVVDASALASTVKDGLAAQALQRQLKVG